MKRQIEQTIARLQEFSKTHTVHEQLPVVISYARAWLYNGAYSYYELQAKQILDNLRDWERQATGSN
jgi:hypothetical protein